MLLMLVFEIIKINLNSYSVEVFGCLGSRFGLSDS